MIPNRQGHAPGGKCPRLREGLREEGFIKPRVSINPDSLLSYLGPFIEPASTETFHFDRPSSLLTRLERRWRVQVTKRCLREVEKVRSAGADVTVIGPGPEDLEAIGANLMDLPRRLHVLDTAIQTSTAALRDPENVGPDHLSDVG